MGSPKSQKTHSCEWVAFFNPEITWSSDEIILLEETDLSNMALIIPVKRSQHCRVRFATPNGEVRTETFTGMTARAFLQSMDFLDGKKFYANSNPIHRERAFRKWNKKN